MSVEPVLEQSRPSQWWRERSVELSVTLLFLLFALFFFSQFVMWVEERSGVVLDDPLLNLVSPVDLTWPIFVVIYGGLLLAVTRLLPSPDALLLTIRSYTLLLLVRIAVMYVTPLAPPEGMILLQDPVAGLGPGSALTNDLFFSGHTATMFLFFLTAREWLFKYIFLSLTLVLGVMLLIQHVHYTLDVVAAPFFTFGCYVVARKIRMVKKVEGDAQLPLV